MTQCGVAGRTKRALMRVDDVDRRSWERLGFVRVCVERRHGLSVHADQIIGPPADTEAEAIALAEAVARAAVAAPANRDRVLPDWRWYGERILFGKKASRAYAVYRDHDRNQQAPLRTMRTCRCAAMSSLGVQRDAAAPRVRANPPP
jgi:hypothetical protein